ncbi:TolC family protein [Sandarakinorhabdus sp.]|uniref:TolC family protein n=1 Tax=Sandarakinorhabdus sp. TaxID=1916663 RepID=UPI00286D6FF2|nr:TolC family protein [Sandarakinorhabdus sp.]
MPISFEAASIRLTQVSDGLAASAAQVKAKQAQAGAVATLRRPEISIDVRQLEYQKSLSLSTGTIGPSLGLPGTLDLAVGGRAFRPVVSAVMPLYSGGQISATQNAARAGIREAEAGVADTGQSLALQLVQAYFGQQLAAAVLAVRTDARAGLDRHYQDARKLEQQGFASRAQVLQAQVARDDAERDYQKAGNDLATATAYLANLLHSDAEVLPTTPLFIVSAQMEPLDDFVASAEARHPQVGRLGALGDQAREGVRIQQAKQRPQVYLFGQYDLNRRESLFTEPDYIYGIGLKYTFLSSADRGQQVKAARAMQAAAEAGLRQVKIDLATATTRAYNDLDTARSQYLLLDSSLAASAEHLRLQQLSFREGLATSLDVIDAQLRLSGARVQRVQAAYQFDVTLAHLLAASGQVDRFASYIARADKSIAP